MDTRNIPAQAMMTKDEHDELVCLAEHHGRSKASLIRWLIKMEAKKVLEENGER